MNDRPWAYLERQTAEAAARRELCVLKTSLRDDPSGFGLAAALEKHQAWLMHLLECRPEPVALYLSWRLQIVQRFGLMAEDAFITDATECVMYLIREGEAHAA